MKKGMFGEFGGQYVSELLVHPLRELERGFMKAKKDKSFQQELKHYLSTYAGRPTPLYLAKNLGKKIGKAKIYLKREDLLHTGAHKINNAIGQVMLAKRMGKTRVIAETGAGQHGVATATAAALFGMSCDIYMGTEDAKRQKLNVFRMKLLGASVKLVDLGSKTLKDAINEALRDYAASFEQTHYVLGSALGPYPYPEIVGYFQSVIGKEAKKQILEKEGRLPDYLVACVGGGSNSIGLFLPFLKEKKVKLVGVEAGGTGISLGKHAARISGDAKRGVLHGCHTYVLQDKNGQIRETHSVSAGLDYPAIGPQHSFLHKTKRARYVYATDKQAMRGFELLSKTEGIIPALEPSHAIGFLPSLAKKMQKNDIILVCLSGRGDKDVEQVARIKGGFS